MIYDDMYILKKKLKDLKGEDYCFKQFPVGKKYSKNYSKPKLTNSSIIPLISYRISPRMDSLGHKYMYVCASKLAEGKKRTNERMSEWTKKKEKHKTKRILISDVIRCTQPRRGEAGEDQGQWQGQGQGPGMWQLGCKAECPTPSVQRLKTED